MGNMQNAVAKTSEMPRQISEKLISLKTELIPVFKKDNVNIGSLDRIAMEIKQVMHGNAKLLNCSPVSIVGACITMAKFDLSLDPNLKHAYLIPYGQKADLQLSYIGLMAIINRIANIKMKAILVYENEKFEYYEDGWDTVYRHTPIFDVEARGNFKCAVGMAKLPDGSVEYCVINSQEMMTIKNQSKGGNVWQTWEGEMMKKAVIRRLGKTILSLVSTDKSQAITSAFEEHDNRVMGKDNNMDKIAEDFGVSNEEFTETVDTTATVENNQESEDLL